MNSKTFHVPILAVFFFFMLVLSLSVHNPALSAEIDCLKCHGKFAKEKVVHPAVGMGCPTCHTGIDASKVPHKKISAAFPKGLTSDQPDLCYGCHDKSMFTRKNVHAAVSMGCTECHNPHSSKNAKLLKSEAPNLCFNCHDKAGFTRKTVHSPVAGGMCLACHSPHSSGEMALLTRKPLDVCLECHLEVTKKPHVVSGFGSKRHPLGEPKKKRKGEEKEIEDPARPGKPFYCGSCHNPHSSDSPKLFKFNARSSMDLCKNCHTM